MQELEAMPKAVVVANHRVYLNFAPVRKREAHLDLVSSVERLGDYSGHAALANFHANAGIPTDVRR